MERREYREKGQRARSISAHQMGRTLGCPFRLTQWGDRWLGDRPSPFTLRSRASGQKLSAALVDEGGKPVQASDIEGVIDPAYTKPGGKRRK